jgi:DNA (cytosine-5)-methyltransferase 1
MQRIARGIKKFVIEAKEPFIIKFRGGATGQLISEPMPTITAGSYVKRPGGNGHALGIVVPHLTSYHGLKGKEARGQKMNLPIATADTSNRFALVTAFLAKYYGGVTGTQISNPMPTVTSIDHNAIVAAHLVKLYGTATGAEMNKPMPTVTGQGQHIAEVRAFLVQYNKSSIGQALQKPMNCGTTKERFGLVTVAGQEYQISDIGLRMLTPRELARAQGFPDSYLLTGSKANQVEKIGNSVCPDVAKALVKSNVQLRKIENVKVG